MLTNRTCTCCRQVKSLSQFYKKGDRPMARCKMCDSRIKQHDRSKAQQEARVAQLRRELTELQPRVGEEFEIKAEPYESMATLEHTARQAMYLTGLRADFKTLSGKRALKTRIIKRCL